MATRIRKRLAPIAVFAFIALLGVGYISAFHGQAHFSDQILKETETALNLADELDPDAGVIVNTFSMRWWVGALYDKRTASVWDWPPPQRWQGEDELARCVVGWIEGCDPLESADALGVKWLVIDTSFPYRNDTTTFGAPENQWQVTAGAPWLQLVYSEGATRLWRVSDARNETATRYETR